MSFSIARSATHVMLVMGIVSIISLFFADMSASPSAFYLLAAWRSLPGSQLFLPALLQVPSLRQEHHPLSPPPPRLPLL